MLLAALSVIALASVPPLRVPPLLVEPPLPPELVPELALPLLVEPPLPPELVLVLDPLFAVSLVPHAKIGNAPRPPAINARTSRRTNLM